MQLKHRLLAALFTMGATAHAESGSFDTSHTVYHEAPAGSNMTVYTPSVDVAVKPADFIDIRAGWEADVVSGASVAVKAGSTYQARQPGADVITSASVKDFRNVGHGGFTIRKDTVTLNADYAYSTENDYKSHSFSLAARTDLFEHNTIFEISYARNFDSVCDRVQGANDDAPRHRALETSTGCFTSDPTRVTRSFDSDAFQGSYTQSWTPVFATQLVYTAQIANGFQSNPYRSIILGEGIKAQEHHPENRARHSLAIRGNWYLRPIKAAVRLGVRGYLDTWDVKSITAELEFEKSIGDALRFTVRGRYYKQSGALFFSDDYTGGDRPLGPKGQYFSGDRELSPFSSYLVGARVNYTFTAGKKKVIGFLESLRLSASFDIMQFTYDEYTLGGSEVTGARPFIVGGALNTVF